MDKLFRTRDEAMSAALEWTRAQHNRAPFPYADPLHAMWGLEVEVVVEADRNLVTTSEGRARFLYPRFDRPFEVVARKVTVEELTDVMLSAKPGLYAQGDDEFTRILKACVYDLDKGISFVYETPLLAVRQLMGGNPTRTIWVEKGFTSMSARQALGGYNEVRKAEMTFLWNVAEPVLQERGFPYHRSTAYDD